MDLVTVIVPVYNVEKYLKESIDSLLEQTYPNLEIILVDDGSKDNSGRICDEYEKIDSRIKVIHKCNAGLGLARNSGLEAATGRFVTFLDSDDRADNDLIELLMKGIGEAKADTSIGGFKRITENGEISFKEAYKEEIFEGEEVYHKLFARMLGSAPDSHDAIRMSVWNVLYSMKIIKEHALRFPSEREFISEDIIWDSEYYQYSKCVKVINSTAYGYRITPGSLTQKYNPERLDGICVLYHELKKRLKGDSEKIKRLQRQFFVNLRECIKQERKEISQKSSREIDIALKRIVNNATVKEIVNQYPIPLLQFKAKVFVLLVKWRFVKALKIAAALRIM